MCGNIASLDLLRSTLKCPVLLVYMAVLAYDEYSKNCQIKSAPVPIHSEQAEQKSSVLEHLCWHTPEYSVFRCGVDRTVTCPVPKHDRRALPACVKIFASLKLFRSSAKCTVLLVYVGDLAYTEYSKN